MSKVFEDYNDLHVRKTYVYAKNGDAYAYDDSATTVKISAADLHNIFLKGAVIVDAGVEYSPVSFKMDGAVGVVTYVKTDVGTATTAVLAVLKSSEFVA